MLISHAEKMNDCSATRKVRTLEANFKTWRQKKGKLINVNVIQKLFSIPQYDHEQELEQGIVKFVH
jgi:hypothetical protein